MSYLKEKKNSLLNTVSAGGRLPSEYQEVEWICSNNQLNYINIHLTTGHYTNLYINCKCSIPQFTEGIIFGTPNTGIRVPVGNHTWRSGWKTQGWNNGIDAVNLNTLYEINFNKDEVYINGRLEKTNPQGIDDPFSFTIFGNASVSNYQIYYFEIKNADNETLGEFIPCYRIADGVIGMYDTVTESFFTNGGTGTFTKGNDI